VIATTSELPSPRHVDTQDNTAQLVGQFYVLRYAIRLEPVHGFLGRHLRRRLVAQSHLNATTSTSTGGAAGAGGYCVVSSDLTRVVDWLPRVWQKVNKFLDVISPPQLDITIGNLHVVHKRTHNFMDIDLILQYFVEKILNAMLHNTAPLNWFVRVMAPYKLLLLLLLLPVLLFYPR